MQDRVPLYPGRVKMTPVAGQANTYDMVRADDPTQAGTPLNKATFLKDATAALYGLGTGAVPDDVLAELGKYKQYWWRRRLPAGERYVEHQKNITGDEILIIIRSLSKIQYASAVDISADGKVTLKNPADYTTAWLPVYTYVSGLAALAPCYVKSSSDDAIYYLPEGATATSTGSTDKTLAVTNAGGDDDYDYIYFGKYATPRAQVVTAITAVVPAGDWEYLQSSDRSAYPDSGEVPVSSVWVEHRENNSDTLLEYNQSYSYATEISIDQATGEVSLVSPQTTTATNASSEMSFIKSKAPCYLKTSYDPSKIYYVPAGATSGTSYTNTLQGNGFPVQFGSSGNPHGMVVTAVQKTISYEYEYLGIPFDNAVTAPKIETGSYVGTGTYGASNPSQITFEFAPSWVIMLYVDGRYPNRLHLTDYGAASFLPMDAITTTYANTQAPSVQGYSADDTYAKKSEDGKILYWYNTNSARSQLNATSDKLFYIAFS